jgi:hypothetical protein
MNADLAILDILIDDATVSGIVGNKVHVDEVPQGTELPYVIIEEDDTDPKDSSEGESAIDYDRIRVFPYHSSKTGLSVLAKAIREAIERKANGEYRTVNFDYSRFLGQTSFKERIENREVYAKDQETCNQNSVNKYHGNINNNIREAVDDQN